MWKMFFERYGLQHFVLASSYLFVVLNIRMALRCILDISKEMENSVL